MKKIMTMIDCRSDRCFVRFRSHGQQPYEEGRSEAAEDAAPEQLRRRKAKRKMTKK